MPADTSGEVFETVTELGEERVAVPAPPADVLSELPGGLNITDHNKPSVFIEACNEVCRLGFDHSGLVGTDAVLRHLFAALRYQADDDDDGSGTAIMELNRATHSATMPLPTSMHSRNS
jgi:hypothetical protein